MSLVMSNTQLEDTCGLIYLSYDIKSFIGQKYCTLNAGFSHGGYVI